VAGVRIVRPSSVLGPGHFGSQSGLQSGRNDARSVAAAASAANAGPHAMAGYQKAQQFDIASMPWPFRGDRFRHGGDTDVILGRCERPATPS
jgi:hypothetical protein